MGAIYDPFMKKKKVEGNEYSKIIEWLYGLSKNNRTWFLQIWELRKRDLEQVNLIYEGFKKSSHPQLNLLTNYLESINSFIEKIDNVLNEKKMYEKRGENLQNRVNELDQEISEKEREINEYNRRIDREKPGTGIFDILKKYRDEHWDEESDLRENKKEEFEKMIPITDKIIEKNYEYSGNVEQLREVLREFCELCKKLL